MYDTQYTTERKPLLALETYGMYSLGTNGIQFTDGHYVSTAGFCTCSYDDNSKDCPHWQRIRELDAVLRKLGL